MKRDSALEQLRCAKTTDGYQSRTDKGCCVCMISRGTLLSVNRFAANMLGYSQQKLSGRTFAIYCPRR